MQITHEEAQRFVQFNADNALNERERNILSAHLQDCPACRAYAEEIQAVERVLLPIMHRHWTLQPIPLSLHMLQTKKTTKIQMGIILTTRKLAIGAVFLAFVFSVWQFTMPGRQNSPPVTMGVPPVPTPSTQLTSTQVLLQSCEGRMYRVQENDTLESIAGRFAVPQEDILAVNSLKTDTLNTGMEIIVPICDFTPTSTFYPTTTYTPSTRPTTFTPEG